MQTVLLIVALSVDVFLACVACGTEKIKIGIKTALCISAICSGVLFLSLVAGTALNGLLQEKYTDILCFAGLLLVGIVKLSEYGIRAYIKKYKFLCKKVKITFSQLSFILSIYNNPVMADKDHSSVMSVAEGVFFALAMSLDGLFGGLGAAMLGINIWLTVICNFAISFLAVMTGSLAGRAAALRRDTDLSWLGGVLFVVLAFTKLF
ncbi:MAG: manganese efflux pump [Roseburia sp.]|nr:manganese efflux pump [Roseburia sp.]